MAYITQKNYSLISVSLYFRAVLHRLHNCCSQHLRPAEGVMVTSRIETARSLCLFVPQKVCCVPFLCLKKHPKQKELQAPCFNYTFPVKNCHLQIWDPKDAVRINSAFAYVLACWTSARLSKALNHAEMQWGLSTCLTALLIHSLCVQKCVPTLFAKQIQTQDNDNIKDAAAEILFATVYLWQVY